MTLLQFQWWPESSLSWRWCCLCLFRLFLADCSMLHWHSPVLYCVQHLYQGSETCLQDILNIGHSVTGSYNWLLPRKLLSGYGRLAGRLRRTQTILGIKFVLADQSVVLMTQTDSQQTQVISESWRPAETGSESPLSHGTRANVDSAANKWRCRPGPWHDDLFWVFVFDWSATIFDAMSTGPRPYVKFADNGTSRAGIMITLACSSTSGFPKYFAITMYSGCNTHHMRRTPNFSTLIYKPHVKEYTSKPHSP